MMNILASGTYTLLVTKAYGRDGPSDKFETYAIPTTMASSQLEAIAKRYLTGRELTREEKLELQQQDRFVNPDNPMLDRMPVRVERRYDNVDETQALQLSVEICRLNLNPDLARLNSYLIRREQILDLIHG